MDYCCIGNAISKVGHPFRAEDFIFAGSCVSMKAKATTKRHRKTKRKTKREREKELEEITEIYMSIKNDPEAMRQARKMIRAC